MLIQKNIYADLPMFISPNPFTGDLAIKKDQSAIQASFKNIVLTALGERPLEPDFGTDIYNLVFEHPYLAQFYGDSSINPKINKEEPRVRIEKIEYISSGKDLNISIDYFILSLNVRDNVSITIQRTR